VDITPGAGIDKLRLLPGMSVRVDTDPANEPAQAAEPEKTAAKVLKASGEIYARDTVALMPPQIQGLWQLNITRMAGDGEKVKKGEPVVVFAGGNVAQELPSSQAKLKEKQRALEKLKLDLADAARDVKLAVAKA